MYSREREGSESPCGPETGEGGGHTAKGTRDDVKEEGKTTQ